MKKFYGTFAIATVIVAHSALRLVMADAYTFSSTDYNSIDIANSNLPETSAVFEPVSLQNKTVQSSGVTSPMINHSMFITSSARSIYGFNK